MSLTDKDIQELQQLVKDNVAFDEGKVFKIPHTEKYYQIIHRVNGTTQALAVVPVENKSGVNADYNQTTIVVAGTQPGPNSNTVMLMVSKTILYGIMPSFFV